MRILVPFLLLPLAAWGAAAPDFGRSIAALAAHKAHYTLSFDASPKGEIANATGTMDYEVGDACDGWTTQQRLAMDVTNADGQTIHMVSDYSTWEAKNGSRLQFRVRQTTDTAVTLELAGQAIAGQGAAPGHIDYTLPKPSSVTMNTGTLFPMAHTAHIIALAETGQKFLTLPLFDGSSDSGTQNTFIAVTAANKAQPFHLAALASLPSDRVHVSFFDHDSKGDGPDYEVAMRYWSNGVADDLTMNFGNFSVHGKLDQFTLNARGC